MKNQRTEHIINYLQQVNSASKELTKKEAFKDLLNRLYAGNDEIRLMIDKITGGSEYAVFNIPRTDKIHRGSADTLYNKIIIEFENDLKSTLNHAKEQLAGYLLGQFNSGEGYNFTLIASDFITWKVFAPDISQIEKLETLREHELILNEVSSVSFVLTETNTDDFYFWIDRFLFKEEKQRATLARVEESFGLNSPVFIECIREMTKHFNDVKKYGEVQVSFEQWSRFLSIAYGSFEATENNFFIHTYLSVFSKMMAYGVVSNDDYIDENELKGIIDGSIFNKYNIRNFVENDFFHWVGNELNFKRLIKVFRLIAQEISNFDFTNVDEDILKGVYQELIDLDTRHALGEYYTPDWLCERIAQEFQFKVTDKILDPSSGSGSLLRAAIHRMRSLHPHIGVEELARNIYGIDIHPLSVQIAKTTILLTLGQEVVKAKKPVHINIILSNTLLAPEGVQNLFGGEFALNIDREKILLNTQVFEDVQLFDEALDVCDDLAEQTVNKKPETVQTFENNLRRRYKNGGLSPQVIQSFYKIYESLKRVKERGRNGIWKFILQNLYKPYFLARKFDYIVGNPPWFTFSSIKNEEYQNLLNELAVNHNVKPDRVANFPHLEIAAIFLSYCSNYFLKESGKIGFVLPRSFFSADHHENTRSGKTKGFKINQIWDLKDVSPLFRIPSCVFFAEKTDNGRTIPATGLTGLSFSGNLPSHNAKYNVASQKLTETPMTLFYSRQGNSSAFSTRKTKPQKEVNPYKKLFKQGATIVPRPFYFVELAQDYPPDWDDRIVNLKTSADLERDAKKPWKGIRFSGRMESEFVYRTALSKSIVPFGLYKPDLVVLPVLAEKDETGLKKLKLFTADELLREGYSYASRWFRNGENIWEQLRTQKNRKHSSYFYLNWQNKLTSQNLNTPYLVLYNASAKDANATVVRREDLDLEFVVESKAYYFATNDLNEAYYLTSILNSTLPNLMMKDFQTRGLFGPRDVHKKILDVYFPKFQLDNTKHVRLAELAQSSHNQVSMFLEGIPKDARMDGYHLGKIRLQIKDYLTENLKEIDQVVNKILV